MKGRDGDRMEKNDRRLTLFELSVLTGIPVGHLAVYVPILLVAAPIAFFVGWLLHGFGVPSFAYLPLGMFIGLTGGFVAYLTLYVRRRRKK